MSVGEGKSSSWNISAMLEREAVRQERPVLCLRGTASSAVLTVRKSFVDAQFSFVKFVKFSLFTV